jgi:hypothetical protein
MLKLVTLCGAIFQLFVVLCAFRFLYLYDQSQVVYWFVYFPMSVALVVIISAILVVKKSGRVIWFVPAFVCGVVALAMGGFFQFAKIMAWPC